MTVKPPVSGPGIRVRVARATNLTRTLHAYQEAGLFVVGLDGSVDVEIGEVAALDASLARAGASEAERARLREAISSDGDARQKQGSAR